MVSPGLTSTRTTSPFSTFSPSSGSFSSVAIGKSARRARKPRPPSGDRRILLVRVDFEFLECLLDRLCVDLTLAMQCGERRSRDVARVHFKEVTQRLSILAAAEAIRTERDHRPSDPAGNHVGLALEIVGCGHHDAF